MATIKPARLFHKPIPERRYRRTIRNRIYLEPDRRFLDSVTTTDEHGMIVLARELTNEERSRVRKLAREARRNRGALRTGKLVILAVLVVGVLLFNLLVKDRLVERGAERLLTSVFGARSELSGVRFRPLAGAVWFDSLTIADARAPMKNLMEMGSGRLHVDSWQLLNGRVLIRDLTVSGVAFGTPRETSGRLEPPNRPDDADVDEGISFRSLGLPDTLDAQAFLERQAELLETPDAVAALADSGSTYVSRWSNRIAELTDAGVASAQQLRALSETDLSAVDSVQSALSLLQNAERVAESTASYAERVERAVNEAGADAQAILDRAGGVPTLVQDDYARLVEQIPDVTVRGRDFLVGLVEPYLRERLGAWYERIVRGYGYFRRLQAVRPAGPTERARRRGRIVEFSTVARPSFELEQAFLSAAGDHPREITLQAISSDPDTTGRPATIDYREGEALAIGVVVDGRADAAARLALTLSSAGTDVSIARGLDALGLERFDSLSDVDLTLVQDADGSVEGSVGLVARGITIAGAPGPGSVGELVRDLLTRARVLTADLSYSIDPDGTLSFSDGRTNLDDQLADIVRQRIDDTLARFERRIRDEMDAFLAPQLTRLDESLGAVVDVRTTAEELLELATDREAAAAELQRRAARAVESVRDAAEAEAQRRLEAAQREAEEAARRAEEAARRQAEEASSEAEEAVRDRAEEVRDSLKLPGF